MQALETLSAVPVIALGIAFLLFLAPVVTPTRAELKTVSYWSGLAASIIAAVAVVAAYNHVK